MSTGTLKLTPQVGGRALTQQWLEEARQTGHTDAHTRRHRTPRITWNQPLEVHVLFSAGRTETHYTTSREISEGGIGFYCRQQIPPFTPIAICRAGELVGVPAMTVHCRQTLAGYIVGAEFRFEQQAAERQAVSKAG